VQTLLARRTSRAVYGLVARAATERAFDIGRDVATMRRAMRFTVILNTFERRHFLGRALKAWERVRGDFEMVLADDGSTDGTDDLVRALAPELRYPVVHVRHAREGHRRAAILNKAVHAAREEAMLFTDADCLPAADLLERHAAAFTSQRLLCGGFLRLSPEYTATIDDARIAAGDHERQLTAKDRRRLRFQHWKHQFYVFLRKPGRPHVMGLNMVIPRSGFVRVNGYDNLFRGWGRADGDLRERLKRVGVRPWSTWNSALTFHMHHPPDVTKKERANDAYADRVEIPAVAADGFAQVVPDVVFSTRAN
jgi:glycosyltransferase involved in cell wall biosynthesis